MAWRKSANSSGVKPEVVDTTTSRTKVYVRRNFEEVPSIDEDGKKASTHWEYEENAVPKEDWETYTQVVSNTESIAEIEDALCDLSKE